MQRHVIQNYHELAVSPETRSVLKIAEAGYVAINTKTAVENQVKYNSINDELEVKNKKIKFQKNGKLIIIGFGKASGETAAALEKILQHRITGGAVIDIQKYDLKRIESLVGTHPLVSEENIRHTRKLLEYLRNLEPQDTVICIVSGGGSALFSLPYELEANNAAALFSALTKAGANILELNTVRKHTDSVKGGNLAKLIFPAKCVSLFFSDVPNDDIANIASGPTAENTTSAFEARKILEKYDAVAHSGLKSVRLFETPSEKKYFSSVENFLLAGASNALLAMEKKALELGLKIARETNPFQGEAGKLGVDFLKKIPKNGCFLAAGESIVKIKGVGKGGRNQEMALSALASIWPGAAFGAFASDGKDNTEAAGALASYNIKEKARFLGLDINLFLENNDSFNFFHSIGGQVITGATGSNIADFVVGVWMDIK